MVLMFTNRLSSFLTFSGGGGGGGGGFEMCDKMAISAYILKLAENDPFLRFQMRAKGIFNRHKFDFH